MPADLLGALGGRTGPAEDLKRAYCCEFQVSVTMSIQTLWWGHIESNLRWVTFSAVWRLPSASSQEPMLASPST